MKFLRTRILIILILLMAIGILFSKALVEPSSGKKLDLVRYHNVGNIWLRISNYGFFGSGGDITPEWPSLEYPGGSGIDYLYRGALWFGAKKIRRNGLGQKLYWKENANSSEDVVPEGSEDWNPDLKLVIDTLVTVGFDGDLDLKEFLPAYNPLETSPLGQMYNDNNSDDVVAVTSIRKQRRGEDDDGDGLIDEDPVGYAFPFRITDELPTVFENYGGDYLHNFKTNEFGPVVENNDIWFPLGFVDLSQDPSNGNYCYTQSHNDDNDDKVDEDGYPVSEQDFIAYYYDYSPFGTATERDYGDSQGSSDHYPLNIRVRQLSYQWSYEHIKNLVYIEFDITNMNFTNTYEDTLYDCAMGIYMDSDVGPQAWDNVHSDDYSSYVAGEGFEFAWTKDYDGDNGLTTGLVGSRVCTPDPELLEFACWTWDVGDGPDDSDPLEFDASGTANEKYWLLTNYRNPDDSKYTSLRDFPDAQEDSGGLDTRYLFGFYGAQEHTGDTDGNGELDYLETDDEGNYYKRWNLPAGKTMKIVVAVFPGETELDLMNTSIHAKDTYGKAQDLVTVTLPDTFIHYVGPEPPEIPMMYGELTPDGNSIEVYWDNRSEIDNIDVKTIKTQYIGWQADTLGLDSNIDEIWFCDPEFQAACPHEFAPFEWDEINEVYTDKAINRNLNAYINPWTGFRLRHDFQGYSLWGRSGSGSQEFWVLQQRWDKEDTDQDKKDYIVNYGYPQFFDFGGYLGIDKLLPNFHEITPSDTNYYHLNSFYELVKYNQQDLLDKILVYGEPLYDWEMDYETALEQNIGLSFNDEVLLFKNKNIPELTDEIYLELYDDRLIPLEGHLGSSNNIDEEKLEALKKDRLARRYYHHTITNPPKGVEYYVAVSSWDRGIPSLSIPVLESARDADANMKVFFPGPAGRSDMDNIYVVPNPYIGFSKFDGKRDTDSKGDKSRRIWFVNLPDKCTIKVWTLAGDLVDKIEHDGTEYYEDIISVSKAAAEAQAAGGIHAWDMLSRYNQIIAPGIYLFSVKDKATGDKKVGKFVIIK